MRAWGGATITALQCGGPASVVTSEVQLIQLSGLTLVSISGELCGAWPGHQGRSQPAIRLCWWV